MPFRDKVKKGFNRIKDRLGGRAPGQSSSSSISNHGQSSAPQPAVDPVLLSPVPNDPAAPSSEPSVKNTAWAALKTSLGLLQEGSGVFGPLKSAVEGISRCFEIFERAAQSREDYEELAVKTDMICTNLNKYLGGATPPTMTSSIESLTKGIEREIKFVEGKQQRNWRERGAEAMDDPGEVLQCYSRIREYLERLMLNANMETWRIVDEQATTNRLRGLPYSPAARYLSAESMNLRGKGCTENLRVYVLETLRGWAYNHQSEKIYWLNGMAGTGKTTIADSFCGQLESTCTLAASFFCSRQMPSCNDVDRILPSISYQLALFSPPFRHALSRILERNPEAHNQSLQKQFEQLIADPLRQVQDTIPSNLVAVIDALDECINQDGVDQVLETLLSRASDLPIKFFVTSRPESKIRDRMLNPDDEQIRSVLHLHDLERSIVREDIKTYLEVKLKRISLPPADLERLVERSGGLFIYAATLVRYIGANNFSRWAERLRLVLNASTSRSSIKDRPIDELYSTVLHSAFDDSSLEDYEKDEMSRVLRTVVCAQEPLTVDIMAVLLSLDATSSVYPALQRLFSVLQVSGTSGLVATLHQSFLDYMFDQSRSTVFYCDVLRHNAFLAQRCFGVIGTPDPPFNICSLESSYLFDEDVPGLDERIKKAISPELFYACRYLGGHLVLAETTELLVDGLREFLSLRLLLWMEVLNLNRCIHIGAAGLQQVQAWSERTRCPFDIQNLARDASGFVATFSSSPASRSTPHIYISALPFWPEQRPVSIHYSQKMHLPRATGTAVGRRGSAPLVISTSARKSALLATRDTPGHVSAVIYSSDGARIVSGSSDKTIQIWDAYTGEMMGKPLEGHTGMVMSVACSPDSSQIASGSWDKTIRIWDVRTGKMVGEPLNGHTHQISSLVYSSDGARIISGSWDNTVRIWDAHTGNMIGEPLQGHALQVSSVACSSDGTRIISGSFDNTIRIWDAHTGQMIGEPLKGHTGMVMSVACSPDSSQIASGSWDKTIRIWDVRTGEMIGEPLEGHIHQVYSVAYSYDGAYIISGSWDRTIRVWDARTGKMIGEPLKGHTDAVYSAVYSSRRARIVSSSRDATMRIWDGRIESISHKPLEGVTNAVYSVACSSDGTRIVSGADDNTIRIWDAHTGNTIGEPLEGHTSTVTSVAYSSDSTRIVSGSDDNTIRMWDAHTGEMIGEPLEGHTSAVMSVAFSSDDTRIISGSDDATIRIWDAHTGEMIGEPLEGHTGAVNSVAYSSDSTRIVSGSVDKTIRIWDAHTANMIGEPLEGHTDAVWSVAYSSDGVHIVSGSGDKTIRVWDAHTSEMIGEPLEGHTSAVMSVAFSSDDTRIISGSDDATIRIWDAHTGEMIGEPLEGHTSAVNSVAYSYDGTRVVSGSDDKTIRVWDAHTANMIGEPLEGHTSTFNSAAYSSDGTHIVSGSGDKTIRIWDAHTGQMIGEPLEGHTGTVTSVAYSSNSTRIVSGSDDATIRIWDAHTGNTIGEPLEGHTSAVMSVAYSSDCTRIVSGSEDKTIRIWDAHTGNMVGEPLEGHTRAVTSVAFSSDSTRIVSGSEDKTIRIWDAHTANMIGEPLEGHTDAVWSVAYSSDGIHIVSGSEDNTIRIWDAHTGNMIGEPLEGHTYAVWSVAYSSDSTRIVSGSSDKTIRIWDAHTGKMIGEPLEGHTDTVTSVAYSSDCTRIVSSSEDNTIRIWDVHTGNMIDEPLDGHTGGGTSVAYSPDARHVVSASFDDTMRVANVMHTSNDPRRTWVLDEDGYMFVDGSKILMWVPADVRDTLLRPQNTAVISTQGSVKVDFTNAWIGDSWARCYQPT